MNFEIEKETYEQIAKIIQSDTSPVGIDAEKTHIIRCNYWQSLFGSQFRDRLLFLQRLPRPGRWDWPIVRISPTFTAS